MSEITLLSASLARRYLNSAKYFTDDDLASLDKALQSIATGHSVCLPVSALREIVGDFRKRAKTARTFAESFPTGRAYMTDDDLDKIADTIEKLLPAKDAK